MSDRDERDDGAIIGPGVASAIGGGGLIPKSSVHDPYDDPNGPVPDNEETHDEVEADEDLMDAGESPEFDHSLRRYKQR